MFIQFECLVRKTKKKNKKLRDNQLLKKFIAHLSNISAKFFPIYSGILKTKSIFKLLGGGVLVV